MEIKFQIVQSKIDAARVTLNTEVTLLSTKPIEQINGSTIYDTIGNQLDMLYAYMLAR